MILLQCHTDMLHMITLIDLFLEYQCIQSVRMRSIERFSSSSLSLIYGKYTKQRQVTLKRKVRDPVIINS